MNTKDLLIKAKELLSDPSKWCQHHNARDASGGPVSANDPLATSFCAIGALKHLSYDACALCSATRLLGQASNDRGLFVTEYNDNPSRTHEEIMAWFDRAIALTQQEKP